MNSKNESFDISQYWEEIINYQKEVREWESKKNQ